MNKKIVLVLTISIIASSFMFQSNVQAKLISSPNKPGIYFTVGFDPKMKGTYNELKIKFQNIIKNPITLPNAKKWAKARLEELHRQYLESDRGKLETKIKELKKQVKIKKEKIKRISNNQAYLDEIAYDARNTLRGLSKNSNYRDDYEKKITQSEESINKEEQKRKIINKEISKIKKTIKKLELELDRKN